ncbi:hypothetical protein [Crossiella cryophila]
MQERDLFTGYAAYTTAEELSLTEHDTAEAGITPATPAITPATPSSIPCVQGTILTIRFMC